MVRATLETHSGRKVKSIGDGLLLEFPNALDAVEFAVDLQRQVYDYSARDNAVAFQIRVGIHLGDVQCRGTDIIGDAVNIASRIQPLAGPGGIGLSAQVYDQIHNKVPYQFERLPQRSLKGIRDPVDVYRIALPWSEKTVGSRELSLPGAVGATARGTNSCQEALGAIQDCLQRLDTSGMRFASFFQEGAEVILTRASDELNDASDGRFHCGKEDEPILTTFVVSLCSHTLHAVSYQDETFWSDPRLRGDYLQSHERLLRKPNFEMVRVFVTTRTGRKSLDDVIRWHRRNKVRYFVVFEDKLPSNLREDYVIYDGDLVRTAEPLDPTTQQTSIGKRALFTNSPRALLRYNTMWQETLGLAERNAIERA